MEPLSIGLALAYAHEAQQRGEGAVIATVVASALERVTPATRVFIGERGEAHGHIHPSLDNLVIADALESLMEQRSQLRSYAVADGKARITRLQRGEIDLFYDVLAKPARLIIVGAGHIAVPLATFAKSLDFEVYVIDDRREYASSVRFPTADRILVGPYQPTLASIEIHSDTHVVLVTRGHVHDQACLRHVVTTHASYVGMIGSRRRVQTVLSHLAEEGLSGDCISQVHAPIGLDIGAQSPAEIALAIMAEIVNHRRRGTARSLSVKAMKDV